MKKLVWKIIAGVVIAATAAVIILFPGRKWLGGERFTVLTISEDKVVVASFDPVTKEGIRLTIPTNLEVETVGGRGKWQAGVLKKAGEIKWAADSLADYLGISYVAEKDKLSVGDRVRWIYEGQNVRWKEVDLVDSGWALKVTTSDGETVYQLKDGWPMAAGKWFTSSILAQDKWEVEVENHTGVSGLGSHAARVLEAAGMKVASISNPSDKLTKCEVVSRKEDRKSLGVRWLLGIWKCNWKEDNQLLEKEMTVRLGEDYQKWWKGD